MSKGWIKYTGDPFVDAGVAVLEIRTEKDCEDLEKADLDQQAADLENLYTQSAWPGYLSVHFPNSGWCNPTMGAEKRRQYRNQVLRSFDAPSIPDRWCAYCGRLAQHLVDRSSIPLLTGSGNMTAGPGGEPGLPVCAGCLFAVQFYPLSTLKVGGRPLFWWTAQTEWMKALTANFCLRVEQATAANPEQMPNQRWPATRLLETAEFVLQRAEAASLPLVDLVACHATNYGSGPEYREMRIRRGVLDFLRTAQSYPLYRTIRDRAWEQPKPKKKGTAEPTGESKRNFLYEDLTVELSSTSDRRKPLRHFKNSAHEPGAFELAALYARKVLEVTQDQLTAIGELADRLAESSRARDNLDRLFQSKRSLPEYCRTLCEISFRMQRGGEPPLASELIHRAFDLAGEDDLVGRDQALVRELILLRVIEKAPREVAEQLADLSAEKED